MTQSITCLFYPETPDSSCAVYQLCEHVGYQISDNPTQPFDVAFKYFDATFFSADLLEILDVIRDEVINGKCLDISRHTVGAKFAAIFGYSLNIDPHKYTGKIIKRSNIIGLDPAEIFDTLLTLATIDQGFVYQKFIKSDGSKIQVVICGDRLAIAIQIDEIISEIKAAEEIFTAVEMEKLILLAKQIGLDFGTLEILRDCVDQKIYVVDIEDTTWRFISVLSEAQKKELLDQVSPVFTSLILKRL